MTESTVGATITAAADEGVSLLVLGSLLIRRRRLFAALVAGGIIAGMAAGLLAKRTYVSSATFIPQGTDANANPALALAASQFGVRIPTSSGGWGPPVYVELLKSLALLEPMARDTVVLAEEDGRRVPLMELLEVEAPTPALRTERTVRALRKIISASEMKTLGAVNVTVATPWPSVSLALADRLVRGVNEFNLNSRKSQATAERLFVDAQATEAAHALREAEDGLQAFLQSNRGLSGSPGLTFDRDRLQRDVTLKQQIYTTLMQSREEARIREVRDTPVITIIEDPRLPVAPESRNVILKGVLGAFGGALLGLFITLVIEGIAGARRSRNAAAREFFAVVDEATPRFLRRASLPDLRVE